jgi:hypothetical protein
MVAMEYHLPMICSHGNVLVAHIGPLSGRQLIRDRFSAVTFWKHCEGDAGGGGGGGGRGGGGGGGGGSGGVWNMTVLLHSA